MHPRVCFIGGGRYGYPLDTTSDKKFRALAGLADLTVVAFSTNLWPKKYKQHATFYLLPRFSAAPMRHLALTLAGCALVLWVVISKRVSIVVAQGPFEAIPAHIARLLARPLGKRPALVIEAHGDIEATPLLYHPEIATPALHRLMTKVLLWSLHRADAFRTVSDVTRRQIDSLEPGKPIVQFPAWTDLHVFLSSSRNPQAGDSKLVVFVGTVARVKGLHVLLSAFSRVTARSPQARLALIGEVGDRRYHAELKALEGNLGLSASVDWVGRLEQRDVAKHLTQAATLVLPSLSEGLGRVVLEAMACRTPVIASRVGGLPELVQHGVTGYLVEPEDLEDLAEQILRVLNDPSEAAAVADRAWRSVSSLFSPERYVQGYSEVFTIAQRTLTKP